MSAATFADHVRRADQAGRLTVQPRMGFSDPRTMRAGLLATAAVAGPVAGTITVDSYTRVGDQAAIRRALANGVPLNGYPIASYDAATTAQLAADLGIPVQVRHGSAAPQAIVAAMRRAGLAATEGGPVSYCLPYGRLPLADSIANWVESCEALADVDGAHLETFGGCLLGQLCPPSVLVATSVLEAIFFCRYGVRSVSLSYAQQTNADQDREAVAALRRLAAEFVPTVDRHIVIYAYMGVYPRTPRGARLLLAEAARLAVSTGAQRLIVKTVAEAYRIPTIDENVQALQLAAAAGAAARRKPAVGTSAVYREARALIIRVLDMDPEISRALPAAFRRGCLDVPFCLHPDNPGLARSFLSADGRLSWADVGRLPIEADAAAARGERMTAGALRSSLDFVQRKFDGVPTDRGAPTVEEEEEVSI